MGSADKIRPHMVGPLRKELVRSPASGTFLHDEVMRFPGDEAFR